MGVEAACNRKVRVGWGGAKLPWLLDGVRSLGLICHSRVLSFSDYLWATLEELL